MTLQKEHWCLHRALSRRSLKTQQRTLVTLPSSCRSARARGARVGHFHGTASGSVAAQLLRLPSRLPPKSSRWSPHAPPRSAWPSSVSPGRLGTASVGVAFIVSDPAAVGSRCADSPSSLTLVSYGRRIDVDNCLFRCWCERPTLYMQCCPLFSRMCRPRSSRARPPWRRPAIAHRSFGSAPRIPGALGHWKRWPMPVETLGSRGRSRRCAAMVR